MQLHGLLDEGSHLRDHDRLRVRVAASTDAAVLVFFRDVVDLVGCGVGLEHLFLGVDYQYLGAALAAVLRNQLKLGVLELLEFV